ncbi:hypothetical protein N657DRAFT_463191 [Parathielavia appendiculata]|uniref:Uncharacterized protein n=1 Tax=Parathielavia appendiculata TaxID=2587402 RepID=A0AAN6Z2Q0_9PEZI|nr:hypothetical protein N657DRAFT_463191 [Parathielavia appendiculata]
MSIRSVTLHMITRQWPFPSFVARPSRLPAQMVWLRQATMQVPNCLPRPTMPGLFLFARLVAGCEWREIVRHRGLDHNVTRQVGLIANPFPHWEQSSNTRCSVERLESRLCWGLCWEDANRRDEQGGCPSTPCHRGAGMIPMSSKPAFSFSIDLPRACVYPCRPQG